MKIKQKVIVVATSIAAVLLPSGESMASKLLVN